MAPAGNHFIRFRRAAFFRFTLRLAVPTSNHDSAISYTEYSSVTITSLARDGVEYTAVSTDVCLEMFVTGAIISHL